MWFWWFMFVCDLLVPIAFLICGWIMRKQAPEKINGLVGYRSRRSMKNVETWKFANEYCGRLWWRIGWVMFLFSVLVQIPFMHSSEDTIGIMGGILCTVQTVLLIVSVIPTEIALKKTFFENERRL
ncbi:MAG: SdpI family protein [Lachnospiraceae bacterium]|nr:SdpI family protein [Lachnospiraceae bacterium]